MQIKTISENKAKIVMLCNQLPLKLRFISNLAKVMRKDYVYFTKLINNMVNEGLLTKHNMKSKALGITRRFIFPTEEGILQAKKAIEKIYDVPKFEKIGKGEKKCFSKAE